MAFTYTGEQVDLGFGRGWMNRPAASSIRRIDAQIGHPLQITEAGRTWGQQNDHFQRYLRYGSPIAMNPDTPSLHQKGNAADSNEAQRIHARMEDNGWRRTVYRYVNGVWTLVEPWHYEYFEHLDNHRYDPAPEEDDMYTQDDRNRDNEILRRLRGERADVDNVQYITGVVEEVQNRIRGPLDRPYDVLQSIQGAALDTQARVRGPLEQPYDMIQALYGAITGKQPVEIELDDDDRQALAASIVELLPATLGTLPDETIDTLVDRLLDEQSKRLAG